MKPLTLAFPSMPKTRNRLLPPPNL